MARTYGALVLVQVLFGLWPVAAASVLREVEAPAIIGFRTLLATPLMFAFIPGARRPQPASRLLRFAGLGLLGIAANQLLYVEGLERAGAVNAAILVTIIPISTLVVAAVLGRERLRTNRVLGVLTAVAGVWTLVGAHRLDIAGDEVVGSLLILGNTTCYATYLVLAKRVVAEAGALVTVAWVFLFGCLGALPFTLGPVLGTSWLDLSLATWSGLAFILAGPTFGTYFLNAYALKRADSSIVAVFIGLQPLVGGIGAWVVLGEVATLREVVAAVLIVAGVAFTASTERRSSG
jgi:drug/metabolite transporter (DMT)-like permease